MKLTVKKAKDYAINSACNCNKGNTSACGINYRQG